MRYQLIEEHSLEEFNKTLQKMVDDNWSPCMNHTVTPTLVNDVFKYNLVMMKS